MDIPTSHRACTSMARRGAHLLIVGEREWQYEGYMLSVLGFADVMAWYALYDKMGVMVIGKLMVVVRCHVSDARSRGGVNKIVKILVKQFSEKKQGVIQIVFDGSGQYVWVFCSLLSLCKTPPSSNPFLDPAKRPSHAI